MVPIWNEICMLFQRVCKFFPPPHTMPQRRYVYENRSPNRTLHLCRKRTCAPCAHTVRLPALSQTYTGGNDFRSCRSGASRCALKPLHPFTRHSISASPKKMHGTALLRVSRTSSPFYRTLPQSMGSPYMIHTSTMDGAAHASTVPASSA